ncbi:hypothetical protein [Novosphingobium sp. B 225]|uniref:hypothetical protein n=1 Tax=Novosphingobium sp. B 225 TaxID=1961849 RepID=UPI0011251805|nr:hypothetical protein [Novosphingobium sp. B 225]
MTDPVSFLPLLEPMAGAGLAVSLAYLALDRFRYRDAVETHANEKNRQFSSANDEDTVEVVKDLQWLCRSPCNGHTPRGFGANFYHYVYRNKADEFVMAALAAISGFTLIAGVGLTTNLWVWVANIDTKNVATFLFYCSSFAIIFPALAVLCGRRCVKWGMGFANHCEREITKIHQAAARAAAVPKDPATMNELIRRRRAMMNPKAD